MGWHGIGMVTGQVTLPANLQALAEPIAVLAPSARWTGAAGSGFDTAAPAPIDPVRITAKPALRLITPSHQWFTETIDVGVMAMANDYGRLGDTFGIAQVTFHYEGAVLSVAEPRWHRLNTERGPRTYLGWWVRLRKPAGVAGTAQLYIEATARDATMQKRVLGPFPFSPQTVLYDREIEINPDLPQIAGRRYQSFAPAILFANQSNAQNPRFFVTRAGRYQLPSESEIPGVTNRWDNTGRFTIEAGVPGVPGVVLGRDGYVNDGAQVVNAQRCWWRFKSAYLTWDNRFGQSLASSGPNTPTSARHWADGITLTNTSPDGKYELVRGMRWTAYGMALNGTIYTEVEASQVYVPFRAASLVRGSSSSDTCGDVISDSACVVQSDFRDADTFSFNLDRLAFTVAYSGPETVVTAARSGGNLSSGTGGGVWTVVIGSNTYTFNHGNSSNAFYTGASGDGYWVSDVVDWLNTLPGVTATLSPELAAVDRAAAALSLPGAKGQGFTATSFREAPLQVVWYADEHGDWYQLSNGGIENVIVWGNRGWNIDGQIIFLAPFGTANQAINDVFFVGNALAAFDFLEANYLSQLSRDNNFSHVVLAHNSINQNLALDDRANNADFSPGYNLITHNALRAIVWRVSGSGITGLTIKQNHIYGETPIVAGGLYTISGGAVGGDLFADFPNGDFTPTAILREEGFAPAIPFDRSRRPFPPVAACGAIAATAAINKTFAPAFLSSGISGTASDGGVLSADYIATGLPAPAVTFQWKNNGANIAGQTARTIALNEAAMGLSPADVNSCTITLTTAETEDTMHFGPALTISASPSIIYRSTLIDELKASTAVRAVYDWTATGRMTAGDGGTVVQGAGDTIALVPNAKTPDTMNLVQTVPSARPVFNNGAVFDGIDDFMRISFAAGTAPASTTIVLVIKTTDPQFFLAGTNNAGHFAGAAEAAITISPHVGAQGSPTYRANGTLVSPTQRGALHTAVATGTARVVRIQNANFLNTGISDIRNAYVNTAFFTGVWMPIAVLNSADPDFARALTIAEAEATRVIAALGL